MNNVGAPLLHVTGVTLMQAAAYKLNEYIVIDTSLAIAPEVALIFLPAFTKVISVMIFGWYGVLGIFLGAALVDTWVRDIWLLIPDLIMFSLGPMIALVIANHVLRINSSLDGIRPSHIIIISMLASLIQSTNVIFHSVPDSFVALCMFVGDLVGSLIMLFSASFAIRGFKFYSKHRLTTR